MPQNIGELHIDWEGDKLINSYQQAQAKGITKVMADCVIHAKDIVPYDTGTLHNSIKILKFPVRDSSGSFSGSWGSAAVNYALWVEIGTSRMKAQPYLRPAADRYYSELPRRIREFA